MNDINMNDWIRAQYQTNVLDELAHHLSGQSDVPDEEVESESVDGSADGGAYEDSTSPSDPMGDLIRGLAGRG